MQLDTFFTKKVFTTDWLIFNEGKEPPLYYLRDKEGNEVDLVVEVNRLHLFEIKISGSIKEEHKKSLNYFESKSDKIVSKNVIFLIREPIIASNHIRYIPYDQISSIKF